MIPTHAEIWRKRRAVVPAEVVAELEAWYRVGGWTQQELADAWGLPVKQVNLVLPGCSARGSKPRRAGGPGKSRNAGEKNRTAKVNREQVQAFRTAYVEFLAEWRERLGLSKAAAADILRGKTWK